MPVGPMSVTGAERNGAGPSFERAGGRYHLYSATECNGCEVSERALLGRVGGNAYHEKGRKYEVRREGRKEGRN